jgi:hypothetical protein
MFTCSIFLEGECSLWGCCVAGGMCRYKPLFDYFSALSNVAFKVVADDYVTDDSGTGVVHCAPAFGEDDYRVCLLNNIIQKVPFSFVLVYLVFFEVLILVVSVCVSSLVLNLFLN